MLSIFVVVEKFDSMLFVFEILSTSNTELCTRVYLLRIMERLRFQSKLKFTQQRSSMNSHHQSKINTNPNLNSTNNRFISNAKNVFFVIVYIFRYLYTNAHIKFHLYVFEIECESDHYIGNFDVLKIEIFSI